ncbi:transcriptional regulation of mitochondrial recombination-domain-containing protein [Lasiosphaeris hirsuta]|uniref:Large ribosomal subunit protein mL67 n=1 Tax=Lasiosphaeris hirsuta TaxID=260670 RepID=A0AA40A7Z1_9PEZI|nr:transcriptional regulation of mitochondrial recombination-domain-containing protein [Lasiosphaeris hirsuta]
MNSLQHAVAGAAPAACRRLAMVGASSVSVTRIIGARQAHAVRRTAMRGGEPDLAIEAGYTGEKTPMPVRIRRPSVKKPAVDEEGRVHGHFPEHGTKIWIHNHTHEGHVMLGFHRVIDSNKGYRQMPYTGKKNVPAKLRKDYWRPMAVIEFPEGGLGDVGRSVYQKLREFKKRHELEWGRENKEEEYRLLHMSRLERGKVLNDQRANIVADIAAVLGGVGKGNKMWMVDWDNLKDKEVMIHKPGTRLTLRLKEDQPPLDLLKLKFGITVLEGGGKKFVDWQAIKDMEVKVKKTTVTEEVIPETEEEKAKWAAKCATAAAQGTQMRPKKIKINKTYTHEMEKIEEWKTLHKTKIYWAEEQTRFHAREWPDNVEHILGIPKLGEKWPEVAADSTTVEESVAPEMLAEPAAEAAPEVRA